MKDSILYFACFLSLFLSFGCGDTEDLEERVEPLDPIIEDTNGIDIPQDWHLTEDPELFVKYYRAVLLERFGDIPQVHIVVEDERKQRLGLSQTHDELIAYLEALYYLFPREETLRSLKHARERKAEGGQVNIINVDAADEVVIQQLMEQRNLNRPEAEAELKKIRAEQEKHGEAVDEDEA